MANEATAPPKGGGRIEGGVDAVVVGASLDGLGAAARLGKAGLNTVLIAAGGAALDVAPREFAPGYYCNDGEHVVSHLDAALIDALDLYRHGLEFAHRRLETVYGFADGGALLMDGDPYRIRESVVAMAADDAERFAEFLETGLDVARGLGPMLSGGAAPSVTQPLSSVSERYLTAAIDDVLDAAFADERLRSVLRAEALFRMAHRPGDPFSFASLIRRWSGETAGLQGAVGLPKGGAEGVRAAARRAAQAARVDFRPATGVTRVLVEWDRAAGVETTDGGQIRAPVVVNALPARTAFLELVGPAFIDIEFQAVLEAAVQEFASARVHFALAAAPEDSRARANLTRRLFYAPDRDETAHLFSAARRGEIGGPPILEAVTPSAFEPTLAPSNGHVVSAIVHPIPNRDIAGDHFRDEIAVNARAALERLAPGVKSRIVATDVRLSTDESDAAWADRQAYAAHDNCVAAWSRSRRLVGASGIDGYFFCGPEAQVGFGLSGAAGRRAADAALKFFKARGHA